MDLKGGQQSLRIIHPNSHLNSLFHLAKFFLDGLQRGQSLQGSYLVIIELFRIRGSVDRYPRL